MQDGFAPAICRASPATMACRSIPRASTSRGREGPGHAALRQQCHWRRRQRHYAAGRLSRLAVRRRARWRQSSTRAAAIAGSAATGTCSIGRGPWTVWGGGGARRTGDYDTPDGPVRQLCDRPAQCARRRRVGRHAVVLQRRRAGGTQPVRRALCRVSSMQPRAGEAEGRRRRSADWTVDLESDGPSTCASMRGLRASHGFLDNVESHVQPPRTTCTTSSR